MAFLGGSIGRFLNKLLRWLQKGKEAGLFDKNGNPIPGPGGVGAPGTVAFDPETFEDIHNDD